MVTRTILAVFVATCALRLVAYGQDVRATARVDSNAILIGDWLTLRVDVQHTADAKIRWPAIPDSLEGLEIVHRNPPTVKNDGNNVLESVTYTITSFDSGLHVIPPLVFQYVTKGDTTLRSAETPPVPVFVRGIAVDTTSEIKDVKPPLGVSLSFAEILPYIIGVLGTAGVIWLVYYATKKRRKGERIIPEEPPRPPHEIALEGLRSLEAERLWQRGKVKEYHSQLTDIVRTYVERKYGILAMEMTTDEILSSQKINEVGNGCMGMLKEMLVRADLVKFAKSQPSGIENESSLSLAFSFVEETTPSAQEPAGSRVVEEMQA